MKILYAIVFIGICQMAYSVPDDEEIPIEANDGEQVANVLLHELQEIDGPNWAEHIPELKEQLEELADALDTIDNEDDSENLDSTEERPGMENEIMMRRKWKKVFHKVKKFGKKVLGSAAASLAGKAIAGAIGG